MSNRAKRQQKLERQRRNSLNRRTKTSGQHPETKRPPVVSMVQQNRKPWGRKFFLEWWKGLSIVSLLTGVVAIPSTYDAWHFTIEAEPMEQLTHTIGEEPYRLKNTSKFFAASDLNVESYVVQAKAGRVTLEDQTLFAQVSVRRLGPGESHVLRPRGGFLSGQTITSGDMIIKVRYRIPMLFNRRYEDLHRFHADTIEGKLQWVPNANN